MTIRFKILRPLNRIPSDSEEEGHEESLPDPTQTRVYLLSKDVVLNDETTVDTLITHTAQRVIPLVRTPTRRANARVTGRACETRWGLEIVDLSANGIFPGWISALGLILVMRTAYLISASRTAELRKS